VLDDRRESSFQLTADHISLRQTVFLQPGTQLHTKDLSVCFSGFIINAHTGITVAHGLCPGDNIFINHRGTLLAIGQCCKTFLSLRHSPDDKITADLALLKIHCDFGPNFTPFMTNIVKYEHKSEKRCLSIKIYRETVIERTDVMIQVRNGEFRFGYIGGSGSFSCRPSFCNCKCTPQLDGCPCMTYNDWCFNMLEIYSDAGESTAMTDAGDSGALVMSRPIPGINYVHVYGIVIGQRNEEGKMTTICNQLHAVIEHMQKNERMYAEADELDFVDNKYQFSSVCECRPRCYI